MKACRCLCNDWSRIIALLILSFVLFSKSSYAQPCTSLKVAAGRDTSVCAGTSFRVGGSPTATGGLAPYSYQWTALYDTLSSTSVANPTASPYRNATYIIKVTDANGCTASDTVTITAGTCNVVCTGASGPNLLGAMGTFSEPYISPNNSTSANCIRNGSSAAPLNNIGNAKPTQTTYVYSQSSGGLGPEGRYTFVKKLGDGSTANCLHNDFRGSDHTGDGGYFMAINGSPDQAQFGGTFFRLDSIPVCPNTDYEFSAWLANLKTGMQTHAAGSFPNVAFFINNVIVAYSGQIPPTSGQWENNWQKAGGTWHSGSTAYASIRIDNYTFVAFGNDLALDDIHFKVCGPVIISRTSKTVYCVGDTVHVQDSVACTNGQPYSWFRWQRSLDGGNTWVNFGNIQSSGGSAYYAATIPPFVATTALHNSMYRVVVSLDSASLAEANPSCIIIGNATTIQVKTPPVVSLPPNDTLCIGTSKNYTPTITGGNSPFQILWTNTANNNTHAAPQLSITLNSALQYRVNVIDSLGCKANDTINIAVAPEISYLKSINKNICLPNNNTITITPSGAGLPFQYLWHTGEITPNRSNLSAGSYYLTITNKYGCEKKDTSVITTTPALSFNGTVANVACFGNASGGINISVSGGTAPYAFAWSNGSSLKDLANVAAGNYSLTVTDANNCTAVQAFTVAQPAAALSFNGTVANVACFGNASGGINISVAGGTAPYAFAWSNGSSLKDLANVAAGNYSLTVTDANNCTAVQAFTVAQPAAALSFNGTVANAACFGNASGGINISVSGGTAPYAFAWSNGSSLKDLANVAAGNYSLTVTDANNCTAVQAFTVAQPAAALSFNGTVANVACFGNASGGINISVAGGTAPYAFAWSNGSSLKDLANVAAGNYSLTVTDANNCTAAQAFTVAQPAAALSFNGTVANVACFGNASGGINISVAGGTAPYAFAWSNGSSLKDLANVAAGNYSLTVTDANNCTAVQAFTVAQPAAALSFNGTVANAACFGNASGGINISVSGGTAPYAFAWSNGSSLKDLANVAAGNYSLTVTDANNCTAVQAFTVAQPAAALSFNGTVANVACFGNASGGINISVAGGTAPYAFAWSNGSSLKDLANVAAGNYSLTVTDANNCTAAQAFTVAQPAAALSFNGTVANVACFGNASGGINISVSGGTAPYAFAWSNGSSLKDLANVVAGNYSLTVTDANNCTAVQAFTVAQPAAALSFNGTVANVACFGNASGGINISVSGGTAPYAFAWSNGSSLKDLANVAAGNYSLTVTDANNCTAAQAFTVAQPAAALSFNGTVANVACFGNASGGINISVSGGTAPYAFAWSNGSSLKDLANVAAGNYSLTVTDANNCTAVQAFTVAQPAAALSFNGTVANVACFGNASGGINISVAGGTAPYAFAWSNGSSLKDLANVAAGNYSLTVTDANNCTAAQAFTVAQPAAALSFNGTVANVACFGNASGGINISVSGGTAPYAFAWSNGSSLKDLANVVAGNYSLTVTDANNCTAVQAFTVAQPAAALSFNGTVANVACFGNASGGINISVSGGTAPYAFAWSNGSSLKDLANVAAGNYSLTVTDANNCTAAQAFTVAQPAAALSFNGTVANVACFGNASGGINISVSGGTAPYAFAWSNGSSLKDLANVAAGNYSLTVTDANNCTAVQAFTVAQPAAALSFNGTVANVACFGNASGGINISVAGGTAPYAFAWSNGSSLKDLANVAAGNYSLTVTDANNCTAVQAFTVAQPAAALSFNGTVANVACFGNASGGINISVAGGTAPYAFAWSNGSSLKDLANVAAGNYSLTVTDANNCTAVQAFTVAQPKQELKSVSFKTDADCYGVQSGSAQINVTGGTPPYFYRWSNGNNTDNSNQLAVGNYYVSVFDANGCTAHNTIQIQQPDSISTHITIQHPLCSGSKTGAATLTVSGGVAPYFYQWNNNQTTSAIHHIAAGNYIVTVTDAKGCTRAATAAIQAPNTLILDWNLTNNICANENKGSINTLTSGGVQPYNYTWSNQHSTPVISNLANGNYTLTVTDKNGCTATKSATITSPSPVEVVLTISGSNSCQSNQNISATALASGGTTPFSYLWHNGSTNATLSNIAPNSTIQVIVKDKNGCIAQAADSVRIALPLEATVDLKQIGCQPNATGWAGVNVQGGAAPYRFAWSNGGRNAEIHPSQAGVYHVTVTDKNGCTASASIAISKADGFTINTIAAQTITLGESIELTTVSSSDNIQHWNWTPDDFNSGIDCNSCQSPNVQPKKTTTYLVTAIDENGCIANDTVTISIIADHTLFVPNTFSPNNDGSNDTWGVFGNLDGIKEFDLKIFNRWGEKVYESSDPHFQWNGTYLGVLQEPGVFVYYMKVIFVDGLKPEDDGKGSITLIR